MITNEVNIEDIGRGGIALYQTPDGRSNLEVKLENDTLWLSVAQMSQLFGRDRTVIQRHLNNIFKEGELEREMVCAKFAHTTPHGAIEGKTQVTCLIVHTSWHKCEISEKLT